MKIRVPKKRDLHFVPILKERSLVETGKKEIIMEKKKGWIKLKTINLSKRTI